jgi:hypothetical protein
MYELANSITYNLDQKECIHLVLSQYVYPVYLLKVKKTIMYNLFGFCVGKFIVKTNVVVSPRVYIILLALLWLTFVDK